ncbi:MAG: HU family DNA-binding protein [Candidatus Competibacteraceae bacterium]|nr:HU family DNA-binding protein [Candidatus Competibacteraceae bacterium]
MPETTTIDRLELADRLVRTGNYPSTRAALAAVDDVTRAIGSCLAAGQTVHIRRFGRLSVADTPERMGHNPKTGEPISISAGRRVRFKPSKALLNGGEL